MNPIYFGSQAELRLWLKANHARETELFVGMYKKSSGKGGITYPEALDEALCFGWIDGVRKSVDGERFAQRFSPRTKRSTWSNINVKRFKELEAEGRVVAAGRAAFEARTDERTGTYAGEQGQIELEDAAKRTFRANADAWRYWEKSPPGYRKIATWWVISAKRTETREKRLAELIDCSARGQRIPLLRRDTAAS